MVSSDKDTNKRRLVWLLLICLSMGIMMAWYFLPSFLHSLVFGDTSASVGSEQDITLKTLRSGVDALLAEENYVIASGVYDGRAVVHYIEVVGENGVSHKEVIVDDDGQLGKHAYGEASEQTYRLLDWYGGNNDYYVFLGDNIYKLPSGIKSYVEPRRFMYAYDFIDGIRSGTLEFVPDIVRGDKVYKGYKARVSASSIWKTLALNSWCSYAVLYEDEVLSDTDEAFLSSLGELMRATEENFTFSEVDVVFGIDAEGRLGYLEFSMGGLGSRLHVQKEVHFGNTNVREMPKGFDSALPYKEYVKGILKK